MARFGRFSASFNKKPNIGRVVTKVVSTVIGLYVGGFVLMEVGKVINGTCSPFYKGLSLIGWTVANPGAGAGHVSDAACVSNVNTVTAYSGTGILSVVGIIALASIVLEFINFKMR